MFKGDDVKGISGGDDKLHVGTVETDQSRVDTRIEWKGKCVKEKVEKMHNMINGVSDESEGTKTVASGEADDGNCVAFYRTKLKSSVADAVAKEIRTKIPNSGRRLSSPSISVSSSSYAAGAGTPKYDGDFSAEVG